MSNLTWIMILTFLVHVVLSSVLDVGDETAKMPISAGVPPTIPFEAATSVTVTPGKPSAPTERITVSRRGAACSLRVERIEPSGKLIQGETVDLAPADFEGVWKIIVDGQLRSFKPEEVATPYTDYGVNELRINTRSAKEEPQVTTHVKWGRPLKNENRIAPLTGKLAQIAHDRARVRLFYLKAPAR